jgi:short subunit fatty acids transporter
MKSAKVVSNIASNKPDGLSIALIIILVLIIVACILWYMLYKPKKEVVPESVESFSDEINNLKFFQKNNIGKEVPTDPVHVPVDVLEGSLMTADQIDAYFGSAKKKTQ